MMLHVWYTFLHGHIWGEGRHTHTKALLKRGERPGPKETTAAPTKLLGCDSLLVYIYDI